MPTQPKKNSIAGKQISFRSKMDNWAEGMDYCAIPVPASVTKTLRTPGARNYILRRIEDAAKPETREKRIQEAVEAAHEKREKRVDGRK